MNTNTWRVRGFLLSVMAGWGAFSAGADSILWEQAPLEGGGSFITSYGNLDYAASFEVERGWRMEELTWWGANASGEEVEDSAFDITIFGDDGTGGPGSVVAEVAGVPSAADTDLETDLTHGEFGEDNGLMRDGYEFSLELDDPLTLDSGAYYLSIDLAESENWNFSWMVSGAGAESSAWLLSEASSSTNTLQAFDAETSFSAQEQEHYGLAFQVDGAVVPEPATAALLGMGVAALSLRWWKRRA